MPFYSGDKEYSDQQVAADAKRCKKERHDWCEQQAREYLAAHERPKYYYTEYYIPEAEQEIYIRWAQDDVETIQKAIADDIAEYGPYENEKEADKARREIIQDLELDLSYYINEVGAYEYWRINDINLEKYVCCEKATVLRFDKEDDTPRKTECAVKLTDEEYIQVLTELLYSPEPLSFDGLWMKLPEIGKKIWENCGSLYATSAIFLTDLNKQVDEILALHGGRKNTPHVDVDIIFSGEPYEGFMTINYADKFYFREECMELDLYRSNIDKLSTKYKRALAIILMRRAMIRKMPYSRFTIPWNKVKQLRDEDFSYEHYKRRRHYHNQSFKFHFLDNLKEYNESVFDNFKQNVAFNMDVFEAIKQIKADAIYLDPPYAGTMNDYFGFYGLLDSYIESRIVEPFRNNFIDKKSIIEQFERLIQNLGNYHYWMLSYNRRSFPTKEILLNIFSRYSDDVQVYEMPYAYRVTGKEQKQKDIEYLFIAKNTNYEKQS